MVAKRKGYEQCVFVLYSFCVPRTKLDLKASECALCAGQACYFLFFLWGGGGGYALLVW